MTAACNVLRTHAYGSHRVGYPPELKFQLHIGHFLLPELKFRLRI